MRTKGSAAEIYRRVRLCVGLLACSIGTYAQSDNSANAVVRVHGIVLNAVTHTPVPRALVTSADRRMAVMTDAKGRFEFDVNLAAGSGSVPGLRASFQTPYLVVKKPGYLAPALPMLLPLDDLAALKADQQLQLMPEASVSGSAVGGTDEVPTGLNVQLLHRQLQNGVSIWTEMQNQQVDARGRFHFGGLTPGDYKIFTAEWVDQPGPMGVSTSKPVAGYPPQFYPSGATGAAAAVLHLGGGQNAVTDLNLRGAKYYQVEVPVVSSSLTNAVQVQVASENGPGYTLGFNAKSQKVEGMLPDGVYHLTVVELGEVSKVGAIAYVRAGTGNLTVAGKPAHGAAIALLPAATIKVNVREDFTGPDPASADSGSHLVGQGLVPLPGPLGLADAANPVPAPLPRSVDIFLSPADPGFEGNFGNIGFVPAMQQDPNTGDLKFSGVPPGRYRVQFNPRRGYVASATANGVDLLRDPLVVGADTGSSEIAIILRDDSSTIAGTVSGLAANSRQGSPNYVIAFPMGDDPVAQPASAYAFLLPDGKFTLSNVVPGRYLVVAGEGRPPSLEYRNKDAMKAHESQGTLVDVTAGQTITVSVKGHLGDPGYGEDVHEVED